MGDKPGDNYCVPLHFEEHGRQHRIGEEKFWEPYGGIGKAKELANAIYELWLAGDIDGVYERLARFKCT